MLFVRLPTSHPFLCHYPPGRQFRPRLGTHSVQPYPVQGLGGVVNEQSVPEETRIALGRCIRQLKHLWKAGQSGMVMQQCNAPGVIRLFSLASSCTRVIQWPACQALHVAYLTKLHRHPLGCSLRFATRAPNALGFRVSVFLPAPCRLHHRLAAAHSRGAPPG